MPNFGLKCFLGSFIFSLLAVISVTKGYFLLNEEQNSPAPLDYAKVQNIELFAQNEESDKIYEKFKSISAPSQVQLPISEQEAPQENELEEGYDDISDTLAFDGEQTGDIIYEPDEEQSLAPKTQSDENKKALAAKKEIADEIFEKDDVIENDSDELEIADASDAPQFIIPLKHLFGTSSIGGTTVSSQTENGPTALASQNVKAKAEIKAEDTDDNPWDTIAVSNRYITKNKMAELNKHKEDLAALDKDKNSQAEGEKETKVAYKMVKNILIPIPEDIMNDENLTPQLSYSDKNKKIDAKLKNEQDARERLKKEQEELAKQAQKIDDSQSKTLSESITDWFAEGKNKEQKTNIIAKDDTTPVKHTESMDENEEEGVFSKLLGLKKKNGEQNIIPSELKLAFQPNRAEISGQTLEWLRAFSENAVKDDEVMIEIRIDGSGSYELQQKRLNLLYTIFANNGVNYDKINIIFTARDPNSFIIRNVKYAVENNTAKADDKRRGLWY